MNDPKRLKIERIALCLVLFAGLAQAGDWPAWRGPTGAGLTEAKDLPLTWGGKTNENVLWKVTLVGRGYSSPVVCRERVFITSAVVVKVKGEETQVPEHFITCYQASDGKKLWSSAIPPGAWPKEKPETYAVPTPVTDGERVYAWFGSSKMAMMAAVDFDGKVLWQKEFAGAYVLNPALSSSPVLYKDTVIQLCDQGGGKGFLLALDRKSGEEKWRQARKTESYNNVTPVLIDVKGKPELIVNASNALQGLDPDNGKLLWSCKGPYGFGASIAYGRGLIYAENGGGGSPGVCVDPSGEGDVTKTNVKWQVPKAPGSYSSPIIAGDYVYRSHKPGVITCWNLKTGKEEFSERVPEASQVTSPFATADGRVYFATPAKSVVIKVGPKLDILATNSLPGGDDGPSPAVSNGRIFLKSTSTLFCIGKK
jgi:outer membrane protein assembly factor BamB